MMVQFDVKRVQKGSESFMVSFDFAKTPITQIADYIIIAASKHNTSDIHFDPREDGMMVRFRIDGDCQDYTFVPKAYEKNLTTRLKILANMNITESRLPQDGAIKGMFGDTYLDMRVSALPLNEGEKIVIRILDYTRSLQGIDSLGFHPKNLEKIKRFMDLPNGIILTTGATGSGKSTTTYSILSCLNKPETNVITVEDPIEMNIEGINQVQVNAEIGMTFAAALRSILRQDPNVILIGEIRDSETAQIAVRASITGHLVLSTIHTNNALATVERLLDMNVERYLLSTALSGIISQRLAKMLCPDCRYQRETTKYEKKTFKRFMQMDVDKVWDANPKGCEHCRRGYHGRIAFHEVLEITDEIRGAISNEKITKKELAKMVYSHGTISMLQDALIKCLEGKTSFEEVYKNIEIEAEDDDNYEAEIESEILTNIPVTPEEEEASNDDDDFGVEEKKKEAGENDVSSLIGGTMAFTAADFADAPEPTPAEGQTVQVEGQIPNQATVQTDVTQQVAPTTEQQVAQTTEQQVVNQNVTQQPAEQQYDQQAAYNPQQQMVQPQVAAPQPETQVIEQQVMQQAPMVQQPQQQYAQQQAYVNPQQQVPQQQYAQQQVPQQQTYADPQQQYTQQQAYATPQQQMVQPQVAIPQPETQVQVVGQQVDITQQPAVQNPIQPQVPATPMEYTYQNTMGYANNQFSSVTPTAQQIVQPQQDITNIPKLDNNTVPLIPNIN